MKNNSIGKSTLVSVFVSAGCCLLAAVLLWACVGRKSAEPAGVQEEIVVMLPVTPVKDQGRSELCWLYAMLATIETEHLVRGDSVNLSVNYLARQLLESEAHKCFASKGTYEPQLRGVVTKTLRLLDTYGVEPYDSYYTDSPVNYNSLLKRIKIMARGLHSQKQFNEKLQRLLDEEMGFVPRHVFMLGAEYTPMEFAHSVCRPGEYLAFCFVPERKTGETKVLAVPDNTTDELFTNMEIDSLTAIVDTALAHGHPVCWEGDMNNANGNDNANDDHAMCIVGIKRGEDQKKYYICKNSWGENTDGNGFVTIDSVYLRKNTIAIAVSRDYKTDNQ